MLILIGISLFYYLSKKYEEVLVSQLKTYLDEHLITRIEAKKIQVSSFKRFPKISVELQHVVLMSNVPAEYREQFKVSDTLLYAKNVFFEFNLLDIIRKDYSISKIAINDGKLNLYFFPESMHNMHIWKVADKKKEQDKLDLKNVILNNIVVYAKDYNHVLEMIHIRVLHQKSKLSMQEDKLLVFNSGKYILDQLENKNFLFFNKAIELEASLIREDGTWLFSTTKAEMGKIKLGLKAAYTSQPSTIWDITFQTEKARLKNLLSLFPNELLVKLKPYTLEGNLSVKGHMYKGIQDNRFCIRLIFSLNQGEIHHVKSKLILNNISIHGKYNNQGGIKNLLISKYSFHSQKGKIDGNFSWLKGKDIKITGSCQGSTALSFPIRWLELDSLFSATGVAKGKIYFEGNLPLKSRFNAKSLLALAYNGEISVNQGNLYFKNSPYTIHDINGLFAISDTIKSANLSFSHSGADYTSTFAWINPWETINRKSVPVILQGDIYSNRLDINKLFPPKPNNDSSAIKFPKRLIAELQIKADRFLWDRFTASNIKGSLSYKADCVTIKNIQMNTIQGRISSDLKICQEKDKELQVWSEGYMDKLDIQELFYTFRNFSQQVIVYDNIKGALSGQYTFEGFWDSSLLFMPDKLTAYSSFTMDKGELIGVESLQALSKYIRIEELKHIRFNQLSNQVFIENSTVKIPQMHVSSSAIDIDVSGIHRFNLTFDYTLKVSLTEILSRKFYGNRNEKTEFGIVKEDKNDKVNLFLRYYGDDKTQHFEYDKKQGIKSFKQNLQNEKKEFQSLFKPNSVNTEESKEEVVIEWEEKSKESLNEIKIENEEEPEFQIEWNDE